MTCPHCGGEIATDGHGVVSCQKCRRVPTPKATHVMVPMPVDDVTWWAESMLIDPDGYPHFNRQILRCRAAVEQYGLS